MIAWKALPVWLPTVCPHFLETGQNLIQIIAKDPTWTQGTLSEKNILLGNSLRTIPYFSEFYLLDVNGKAVTGYPVDRFLFRFRTPRRNMGITLALNGLPIQMYTLPPSVRVARLLAFPSWPPVYRYPPPNAAVCWLAGQTWPPTRFPSRSSFRWISLSDTNGEGMLMDDTGHNSV